MKTVTGEKCNTHIPYHSVKGIPKIIIYKTTFCMMMLQKITTLNVLLQNSDLIKTFNGKPD